MGRGLRQGRAVRGEGPRRASGRSWPRPRSGGRRSSTPASAGSPGPTSTAAASCRGAYERRVQPLEGQYDVPEPGRSSASGSAWWRRRSSPTPPTTAQGRLPAGAVPRRHRRLPAVQRAGRRLATSPALQTKAERDGDEWIITGQKVWTSGAQYSDIGEIICRTDPDLPKHKGLTGFVVDMHAPGVEVRPLRQMTGGATFNEVFFNEVRVPDDHRLGDVNQGWTVALTTLMNERASIGAGGGGGSAGGMTTRAHRDGAPLRPRRRPDRAPASSPTSYIRLQVASYTNQRAMDKIKAGPAARARRCRSPSSPLTSNMRRTAEFVADVLGPRIVADTGEWGTYAWGTVRARHARHAHRRRHRRGHAQHRRRAGARPAQGRRASTRRRRSTT